MARIYISLSDLCEDKQMEYVEAVEAETGEDFYNSEVSHECYIQVDISEDDVTFT